MKHKLLVILGTTSTGKTDVGLDLAKKLNGEIISADSRQVYKYLDIGTGKLPGSFENLKMGDGFWEIDGIKIWLYDVVLPKQRFNLYEYILKAVELVGKVKQSGKLPILVGGTGLYIRSLLEGISDFGTDQNRSQRAELESLEIAEVKKRIENLKTGTLEKLNNSELSNKRRLVRLLEKLITPNNPAKAFPGIAGEFDVLKIGLRTNRQVLRDRIKKRLLSRIDQGMVNESKKLLEQKILTFQRMEELGLEYRYLAKFLKGEIKTRDELIDILSIKISQFAKRQETWFKKDQDVVWFDISEAGLIRQVEKHVAYWYNKP
jgi:tRNA dimethylallyltransferase